VRCTDDGAEEEEVYMEVFCKEASLTDVDNAPIVVPTYICAWPWQGGTFKCRYLLASQPATTI
jgi:hypothetical protein